MAVAWVVAGADSLGGTVAGRCLGPWVASAAHLFFEGDLVDVVDTAGLASRLGSAAGSGWQLLGTALVVGPL